MQGTLKNKIVSAGIAFTTSIASHPWFNPKSLKLFKILKGRFLFGWNKFYSNIFYVIFCVYYFLKKLVYKSI